MVVLIGIAERKQADPQSDMLKTLSFEKNIGIERFGPTILADRSL
jgi:hypothetical protein